MWSYDELINYISEYSPLFGLPQVPKEKVKPEPAKKGMSCVYYPILSQLSIHLWKLNESDVI